MPDTTDRFALEYPLGSDGADGPGAIQGLAEQLEERLAYAGAQGGASVIAAEQTRSTTSFGELGTPDRVSGLVVPDERTLIAVVFSGLVKCSAGGGGGPEVALFLDNTQIQVDCLDGSTAAQAAPVDAAGTYRRTTTFPGGLATLLSGTPTTGITTGQVVGAVATTEATADIASKAGSATLYHDHIGGILLLRAAPDTYDVSVRFKPTAGTLSAKERFLAAWTLERPASGV